MKLNLARIKLIFQKELKLLFRSPYLYITTGIFCLTCGWLFYNYIISTANYTDKILDKAVLIPMMGNLNFLFLLLSPLLTMASFAEERKQNTLSLLLTSPLTEWEIIIGKMLALFTTSFFILLLTLIFPLTLAFSGHSNWSIVFSGYLGLTLSIFSYLAVGFFASSLTKNLIISILLGYSILMSMLFLAVTGNISTNYIVGQIFNYLSTPFHFEAFARGSIKSYDIIYYLSFAFFFLYLTYIKLISRKW